MVALRVAFIAMLASCLGGCLTPTEVANPDTITLRTAVDQVVDSLHEARDRYKNDPKLGLYPSEATVTFNISSQSTEATGLQIGASAPAAVTPIPISLNASDQVTAVGQRGNQITITFKNVLDLKNGSNSAGSGRPGSNSSSSSNGSFDAAQCVDPTYAKTHKQCNGVLFQRGGQAAGFDPTKCLDPTYAGGHSQCNVIMTRPSETQ
jgi:hypothetical protein